MKETIRRTSTKLSGILKTDVAYLVSGGFWLSVGQFSSAAASFLLTIAFANLVTPDTYGTYKFIIAVAAIIAIPTLAGINVSLIRAVAQKFEGNIKESIKLKLQWGTFSFLIGVCIALFYYINNDTTLALCFLVATILIPFMEGATVYSSILQGKKRFDLNAKFESFLFFAVSLGQVAVLFLTDEIIYIITSYFALWTLGRIVLLLVVLRRNKISNSNISHESLSLGKHLSIMKAFNTIASNLDRVVLFAILGPASVAAYSIALAPVLQIKVGSAMIKTLSLPKFSEKDHLTIGSYLRKLFIMTGALTLGCVAYILLSPLFFELVFPKYTEAVVYSQILAVGIISFGSALNGAILIAKNAKKLLYIQTAFTYGVQIIFVIIGIVYFDILGAVVAFVLSQFFYLIFSSANVISILRKQ